MGNRITTFPADFHPEVLERSPAHCGVATDRGVERWVDPRAAVDDGAAADVLPACLVGAAEAFRAASTGRRAFIDPLLNLAALAVRHGDRAEAARKIDEALARDPESARARAMKAEITGDVR